MSGGFFRGSHRTGQQALSRTLAHAVHGANARPGFAATALLLAALAFVTLWRRLSFQPVMSFACP